MTDQVTDEFLEHFGVLGMHWGQHKAVASGGSSRSSTRAEKKLAKKDAKWEKKVTSKYPYEVYNKAAHRMNSVELTKFNSQPKYKGKDLTDPNSALTKSYYKDYSNLMTRVLNEEADKSLSNPSGTKRIGFEYDVETDGLPRWNVVDK